MSGVTILSLGYGNTRSVALAFERLGAAVTLTDDAREAERAERLVLPGVGAAGHAMARLQAAGLDAVVRERTRPTLGICLGMQLLFGASEEDGGTPLLGVLTGDVTSLIAQPQAPVPHMGWSRIVDTPQVEQGLAAGDYLYFAHSYRCPDHAAISARVDYGGVPVPAALAHGPLWGAQFHPERSAAPGARFLEAFLRA